MDVTAHSRAGDTVELHVVDPDDAQHQLSLSTDGAVGRHWCDQYPRDGPEPSADARVRLARVERFAQYYLARSEGYETLSPYTEQCPIADPDRLVVTTLIVGAMSQETLESQFEACYDRLTALGATDTSPLTATPTEPAPDWAIVEQDVSLTVSTADVRRLADALVAVNGPEKLRRALDIAPDRGDADLFARLDRLLSSTERSDDEVTGDRFLAVEPPVRVYRDAETPAPDERAGGPDTGRRDGGADRTAGGRTVAARIQLTPACTPIDSAASFQRRLVDHLRRQLRDSYVGMGLRPPSGARVTGPGIAACTERYDRVDALQNYHHDHAIVDWSALGSWDEH